MDDSLTPQDQENQQPSQPVTESGAKPPAKGGYGKKPTWFWIVLYLVVGAVVYFLIYYFFLSDGSAY